MSRLHAIVLDLDDTLLDTSRVLLPAAERRAVEAMRAAGLPHTVERALDGLSALRSAGHAADAFARLAAAALPPADAARVTVAGTRAFLDYEVPPLDLDARVAHALDALAAFAPLALFTVGVPSTQLRKIERLGIAPRFVDCAVVDVRDGGSKTPALREMVARHAWTPSQVVVVGDSLASDVAAAVATGCIGVHVRAGGERAFDRAPSGVVPHHVVDHVAAVPAVLERAGYFRRPDSAS